MDNCIFRDKSLLVSFPVASQEASSLPARHRPASTSLDTRLLWMYNVKHVAVYIIKSRHYMVTFRLRQNYVKLQYGP